MKKPKIQLKEKIKRVEIVSSYLLRNKYVSDQKIHILPVSLTFYSRCILKILV